MQEELAATKSGARSSAGGRRRERGVTLIEAVLALLILGIVLAFGMSVQHFGRAHERAETAGLQLAAVRDAAQAFLSDHAAGFVAPDAPNERNDGAACTTTVSGEIRPDALAPGQSCLLETGRLVALHYLPGENTGNGSGWSTNPWGQDVEVWIRRRDDAVPTRAHLDAVVVAAGGRDPGARFLGTAARTANGADASAGIVYGEDDIGTPAPVVSGVGGRWNVDLRALAPSSSEHVTPGSPPAVSGVHLASAASAGARSPIRDILYTEPVPGHPEANRMITDLHMNGNDIEGPAAVRISTVTDADEGGGGGGGPDTVRLAEAARGLGVVRLVKGKTAPGETASVEKPACPDGETAGLDKLEPRIYTTAPTMSSPTGRPLRGFRTFAREAGEDHWSVHARSVEAAAGGGAAKVAKPAVADVGFTTKCEDAS